MPKIFSERDREVIRNKLLNEGLRELESKRYRHISLDDITAHVGIAKGTFYHFFPSKEDFFYEVMQHIKKKNRSEFHLLTKKDSISKADIADFLFHRYTHTKTVYDYFTPEEMTRIVRKLPDGDSENDSVEFAKLLCEHIHFQNPSAKPEVIVNLCNVLALTASNKHMLEEKAYDETIRLLCQTLADYILGEEEK